MGRRDDFKSRHADLGIELLLNDLLASDFFNDVDFERRGEVIIADDPRQGLVGDLSELVLVYAKFELILIFPEAERLTEDLLKLVARQEEQVDHFAHWNADWLDVGQNATLAVNVDDLDA